MIQIEYKKYGINKIKKYSIYQLLIAILSKISNKRSIQLFILFLLVLASSIYKSFH